MTTGRTISTRVPLGGRLAAGALVVALAAALASCTGGSNAVDSNAGAQYRYVQSTKKGELIPAADRKAAGAMKGKLMAGESYQLSADVGQVVVLNYFASWCPPCQTETPQFDSVYRDRKGKGVTFVGVDAKDSPKSGAASWIQTKEITFPVLYDPNAQTALELGGVPIVTLPATVLIDKQGKVAAVYQSSMLPADLNPLLDQLVKETA
jgi:peroxiredoxin